MAARSTSRFKRKPAVPFGDFMLPILGVIALGIVVMGIRMLWAPSTHKSAIVPQTRVTQSKDTASKVTPKGTSKAVSSTPQAVSDSAVAVPKSSAGNESFEVSPVYDNKTVSAGKSAPASAPVQTAPAPVKNQAAQAKTASSKTAQPKPKSNPQPKPAAQPKPSASAKNVSVDKSQFIVQCGSFTDKGGADTAVSKLKSLGYSAVIRKADVRGKSYYRVVVGGGSNRNQAEAIEADIKQKTSFPTLVRSNSGN